MNAAEWEALRVRAEATVAALRAIGEELEKVGGDEDDVRERPEPHLRLVVSNDPSRFTN